MSLAQFVSSLGYLAVFALVAAESLGVPLPGETALIIAAVYAGHSHKLSPWLIFLVATAAAIVGDNIGYWIGRKGGYRVILALARHGLRIWAGRWRRVHPVDERKLKIARYLFGQYGGRVVFFGRFVSVLRTYAAFLAGVNHMRWPRFLIANTSGGIVWAGAYTLAGYLAGSALERASGTIALVTGAIAASIIIVAIVILKGRTADLAKQAEEAYPGPLREDS